MGSTSLWDRESCSGRGTHLSTQGGAESDKELVEAEDKDKTISSDPELKHGSESSTSECGNASRAGLNLRTLRGVRVIV